MSILIRDMEMPPQGEFKHIRIYENGEVTVEVDTGKEVYEAVIANAIPIPPHGRLIDADALKDKPVPINGVWDDERNVFRYYPPTYMQAIDEIVNAPTIIEAEGGET